MPGEATMPGVLLPLFDSRPFGEAPTWRVSLTVGLTTARGIAVRRSDLDSAIAEMRTTFNDFCGGSRLVRESRAHRLGDGRDLTEDSLTCWAFGSGVDVPLAAFRDLAARIAARLQQETALLVVERILGGLYFISLAPA